MLIQLCLPCECVALDREAFNNILFRQCTRRARDSGAIDRSGSRFPAASLPIPLGLSRAASHEFDLPCDIC